MSQRVEIESIGERTEVDTQLDPMAPKVVDLSKKQKPQSFEEEKEKKKFHRTIEDEYEKMVRYIEDPKHFAQLTGAGRKTKSGAKVMSKTVVFVVMAAKLGGIMKKE
ncbi:hypothetical protein R1flu_024957 [Riccia fluitans]|uniref:Uncharacterized protein n=1 Tax=Riccia fluitans TaxID=41844 RepID=A0ABD1XWD7_9MARC